MAASAGNIFANGPKTTSGIIPTVQPPPVQQSYNLYNTAVKQQAGDYDSIMAQYKALAAKASSPSVVSSYNPISSNPVAFSPVTPQSYAYTPTADVTNSLSKLNELATTGGYSEQDKADIRARGISPIRAVYAGANRDVDRGRVLSGGFSPNYAAVKAKMARELSDTIAGQVTNVNAGLAQNIASNRLAAASPYASAAGAENSLRANVGLANTGAVNSASLANSQGALQASIANSNNALDTNKFNAQMPLEYAKLDMGRDTSALDATKGQASLYGTTPALANMFGNQALSAAQLQALIDQQGNNNNLAAAGQIIRR